jgi:hypothetical protein
MTRLFVATHFKDGRRAAHAFVLFLAFFLAANFFSVALLEQAGKRGLARAARFLHSPHLHFAYAFEERRPTAF